jgi:polyribonucleotide 5'-hydroxyl-kinase
MCPRDEFLSGLPHGSCLSGVRMHVTGHPSTEYVSEETPMVAYANLHIAFEQMRVRALSAVHGSPNSDDDSEVNAEPPRILVLGPENSGKTTVCKILTNYAVRAGQGWSPLLVNVDTSEVRLLLLVHH